MIGTYLESARLIGQRTAELHVTLASDSENPDFSPEPFSALYQRSIYQSMRTTAAQSFHLLRTHCKKLPDSLREDAQRVAGLETEVLGGLDDGAAVVLHPSDRIQDGAAVAPR